MFCPNCGAENRAEQNFCRTCGLNLYAVTRAVAEQFPSEEYARLQRRRELFDKLATLSIDFGDHRRLLSDRSGRLLQVGSIGTRSFVLVRSRGVDRFLLLAIFFFNYPKLFMKSRTIDLGQRPAEPEIAATTAKLIDDRPFDGVPSVTEDSTDLLLTPDRRQSR